MSEPRAAQASQFRTLIGHPLVPVAWSVACAIGYALFPSSDTNAVVAEVVWIVGFLAWMVLGA